MIFNSLGFLIFFPIVLIITYIVPKGLQNFWLLLASYWFYMSWNPRYGLLLLLFTVFTYICGLVLGKASGSWEKVSETDLTDSRGKVSRATLVDSFTKAETKTDIHPGSGMNQGNKRPGKVIESDPKKKEGNADGHHYA